MQSISICVVYYKCSINWNTIFVEQVVQYGNAARSTGVSSANAQSSRSHAILQLEIRDDKDVKQGRYVDKDVHYIYNGIERY